MFVTHWLRALAEALPTPPAFLSTEVSSSDEYAWIILAWVSHELLPEVEWVFTVK